MGRRRQSRPTLTGTRIYVRGKKYAYYNPTPVLNPKTGMVGKWHLLCPVADGEFRARELVHKILGTIAPIKNEGNFATWFRQWREEVMSQRQGKAPKDPARLQIWNEGTRSKLSVLGAIEKAFVKFDLDQIRPADVANFVDQWLARRIAYTYRGELIKFFKWCCRKDCMHGNPAREVDLTKEDKRNVYITHEQFNKIYADLPVRIRGKPTGDGLMMQCYVALLYLLYQRGTDIRLLRWDQIQPNGILFKPTKTEKSSGKQVLIPVNDTVNEVLATAKAMWPIPSDYVIRNVRGRPYTANEARNMWRAACERVGVEGVTLKDIRAKAATDASTKGYNDQQIQTALVHTDAATTRLYLRGKTTEKSEVSLNLPGSNAKTGDDKPAAADD